MKPILGVGAVLPDDELHAATASTSTSTSGAMYLTPSPLCDATGTREAYG